MSKRELKNYTLRFILVVALLSLILPVALAAGGNPTCASGGADVNGKRTYTLHDDNGIKAVTVVDKDGNLISSVNGHGNKDVTITVTTQKNDIKIKMDDSGSPTHHCEWKDANGAAFDARAPDDEWDIRGGLFMLVNRLGLLAPYIGLASTTMIGVAATFVYVERVKRRKEK